MRQPRPDVCVVFDILRATSTFVTALHHGAVGILPVADISSALAFRARQPEVLLAGERHGLREQITGEELQPVAGEA